MKLATGIAVLGVALGLLAAEPGAASDWTIGTDAGMRTGRIGGEPGASDWNSRYDAFLTPRIAARLDGQETHSKLSANQEFMIQRTTVGYGQITRPRLGGGSAELQITQGGRLGTARLYGRFARSTTPLDVQAPVAAVPGAYATWTTGARATLSHIEGGAGFHGWTYEDQGLATGLELTDDVSVIPVRWGSNAALVGWRQRVMGADLVRTFQSEMAVAGLRRGIGAGLNAQVEGGVSQVQIGVAPPVRGPGFSVLLSGPNADEGPVRAVCTVQRGLPVTVLLAAEHSRPGLRTSARWESGVDSEGGWRRPPNLVRRIAVAVEDTLFRTNLLGAEVSGARLWPMTPPVMRSDALRFNGWLARRVQPWLTVRVDYTNVIEGINRTWSDAPRWYRFGASLAVAR